MSQERLRGERETQWAYPELQFGFGYAQFQPGDDPSILARDVLSSLWRMEKYTLPEICPDGFPEQPVYSYNTNKLGRINNFLRQKVTSPSSKQSARREEVVDIYKAAATVMDGLSESNHPVSQALVALDNEFTGRIPQEQMDFVTLEVLKQTHWRDLRGLLNIQVAVWRMDQYFG